MRVQTIGVFFIATSSIFYLVIGKKCCANLYLHVNVGTQCVALLENGYCNAENCWSALFVYDVFQ